MEKSRIIQIATANPEARWHQNEILESVHRNRLISRRAGHYYKKFLSDKGIETRHFGLTSLEEVNTESPDVAEMRFARVATEIGSEAVRKCLRASGTDRSEIDGLVVTTCTGYLCPGLTSYVSEAVGLRENIFSLDLAGSGCGAALPALRAANQYLQTHPECKVMVLCVEICSAAISWGDAIDLILSNSIFSDGAAACLVSNQSRAEGLELVRFESLLWPQFRDDLRFQKRNSRLCNVINKNVPEVAAKAVKELRDRLVEGLVQTVDYYGVHPGGRRILDVIEETLGLESHKLDLSREVLREYGNMSSPSILYVLKKIIEKDRPADGEQIAIFSFGAGFTAFGAVLQQTVRQAAVTEGR